MRHAVLTILSVFLVTTGTKAQKAKTVMGDAFAGVVESNNETTREITIVYSDK